MKRGSRGEVKKKDTTGRRDERIKGSEEGREEIERWEKRKER